MTDVRDIWLAIRDYGLRHRDFTSDDVRSLLPPHIDGFALGAAFAMASAQGAIVKTGAMRRSKRVEAKGRELRVWRLSYHGRGG